MLGAPPPFAQRVLADGLDSCGSGRACPSGSSRGCWAIACCISLRYAHGATTLLLPADHAQTGRPLDLLAFFATTVLVRLGLIASGRLWLPPRRCRDHDLGQLPGSVFRSSTESSGSSSSGSPIVASGQCRGSNDGYRRAYLWMIPVEVALRLLAGNKSGLLLGRGRGRVRPGGGRQAVPVAAKADSRGARGSLLVVFPLVGTYRDILRPAPGQQALLCAQAPAAAVDGSQEDGVDLCRGPSAYSQFAFDQTAGRLREIDRAAVSIQAHDAGKPYSSPSEMAIESSDRTCAAPVVARASRSTSTHWTSPGTTTALSTNVISASSLSPVGDAYRYGGLAMVVLALALVGAFVRFLDEMLAPRHSIWLVPLLIAAIPLIRGGDLAGLLVGAIRYFLIVGIFYRFLFVRAERTSVTSRSRLDLRAATLASGRQGR